MMQMDYTDWLLFTAAMYPIIGMLLYAISIIALSSEHIRGIAERNNNPPIWVMIVMAALSWPFVIAIAVRKGRA